MNTKVSVDPRRGGTGRIVVVGRRSRRNRPDSEPRARGGKRRCVRWEDGRRRIDRKTERGGPEAGFFRYDAQGRRRSHWKKVCFLALVPIEGVIT